MTKVVYAEATSDVRAAIAREKQIKGWLRAKKITLIESLNPEWEDLSETWFATEQDPSLALRMTGTTINASPLN